MTDAIDAEAEALARARYESGRPMLSGHFDARLTRSCAAPWPTVPSWSWSSPWSTTMGWIDGNPTRSRVAMSYEDGDFGEDVLAGATTLREALTRVLGQLNGQPN